MIDDTKESEKALKLSTRLILNDLEEIELKSRDGKLDHLTAQDLVRYHSALIDRKFSEIQASLKEQDKYASMTKEELLVAAQKEIDQVKFSKGEKKNANIQTKDI